MCKGLVIIAEKIDGTWKVYGKQGVTSHDDLLHELDDDLRYGVRPHLKFEVLFPCIVHDDIDQIVAVAEKYYPKEWVVKRYGKWCACLESIQAVTTYLSDECIQFTVKQLQGADLQGAYLRNANLRDADLRNATLWDADLQDADLRGANLRNATLWDADLEGANLRDADLEGADLRNATLRDADLRGANLRDADLRNATLWDADLQDADLRGANLEGANGLNKDTKVA
jgi:hypothetical protein